MIASLRHWLKQLPYEDELQRRQAGLLQGVALTIGGAAVIGMGIGIATTATYATFVVAAASYATLIATSGSALWLLRRGSFRAAGHVAIAGLMLAIAITMVAVGMQAAEATLLSLTLPITLAGMVMSRRSMWAACITAIAMVALNVLGTIYWPQWIAFVSMPEQTPIARVASFALIVVVLSVFLDRFGSALHESLTRARVREQELESLRASLEQMVTERTASLQRTIDELSATRDTVRALSVPALPILPGVLVLPLIGALDTRRATEMSETVLAAVVQLRAKVVIFDITGVPLIDTQVVQALLQTAAAVRLLGAEPWMVGIRADVAHTIVALGVDLQTFRTSANLEEAVSALIGRQAQAVGEG